MNELNLSLRAIAVGFEDNKPQIVIIDQDGKIYYVSESFHGAIGSGEMFSEIYFNLGEYSPRYSLEEGLLFAFRAKKSAESHTGVGMATDILVICKNGNRPILIRSESEKMAQLLSIYTEEKSKVTKIYNEMYQRVKEVISNAE
ncbi:MAG: hypothetical protein K9W43_14360 [Candidatus Thorarchaeota archaeon]|nr:hypothetical protein [Candidatus Thorarchaeota archaeon]